MAAYAALTSLINLIHQFQNHPSPPISVEKQQLESLTEIAITLQQFLETYHSPIADSDEADPLEMRIADAAYAVEDVIESYIVDNIKHDDGDEQIEVDCITFYKDMQKVIEEMDMMARKVTEMVGEKAAVEPQLKRNYSTSGGSSRSSSIPVGFDDVSLQILDKLTAEERRRRVIPIVGMGGIGKTTLARYLYEHPLVKEHFHICAWATISQKYNTKEILCDLLSETKKKSKEELSDMSDMIEDELGLELHRCLFGRRFLIVMDDMWSIKAWDEIQRFLPDNGNRSRIVVTTRLSPLDSQLDNYYCLKMKFLGKNASWNLFSKTVFGEEGCPTELKEIGKKIVETCKGLPLSIVVMGSLLKNLEHTQECWESIRKNSSSIVNSVNEDYCLKILKMSYNHLPVYLKPCFLYMGVFKENSVVRVSWLVKLWVSEGFIKPASDKCLETAAREYLNDLVDRNLVQVHGFGSIGNIKYCKIHDLFRDLCWREARKEGFYDVIGLLKSHNRRQRCVFIHGSTSKEEVDDALRSMPLARSFLCDTNEVLPLPESRLLRILHSYGRGTSGSQYYKLDDLFGFVNSRLLAVGVQYLESEFLSSISFHWNLQTLKISCSSWKLAPIEIWKMSQLRHVKFCDRHLQLASVPSGNIVSMENLQTLKGLYKLGHDNESMLFPNIKKLEVGELPSKLEHLTKLESYRCWRIYHLRKCSFPNSLKKLSLGSHLHWDIYKAGLLEKIGALPLLQKLKLEQARFPEWETREDQFPSLKYLELKRCDLYSWRTESSHFPRLEELHLYGLKTLEEIPCEIGAIATLQSIVLEYCSEAVVESAKKISEEQDELRVLVVLSNIENNKALRSLTSPNFLVEIVDFVDPSP